MPEPEMKFCGLCGKNRPENDFVNLPLAMLSRGPFVYCACQQCSVVIHNIRRVVKEEAEKQRDEALNGEGKGLIIVPSIRVPHNLRS